jgi:hypothetical protein
MKTSMTKTAARVIGVILILTGLVFAQVDTFKINCKFTGDIGACSFTVTATPTAPSQGGGTLSFLSNSTSSVTFTNLSVFWTGKISITPSTGNYGFIVTPKDTQILDLMSNITINVTVTDTSKPVVKLSHLNGITINVNQPFTFYDSIKENTKQISNIKHDYSVDSGKTWDSACYQGSVVVSPIIFTGYQQSFTPTKACDNFMLRVIVTDPFHSLADTDIVTFKVKDNVGVYNPTKTVRPKNTAIDYSTFDLAGRKIASKGPSKFYIKNARHSLIVR